MVAELAEVTLNENTIIKIYILQPDNSPPWQGGGRGWSGCR
jgi:hypothetical protein